MAAARKLGTILKEKTMGVSDPAITQQKTVDGLNEYMTGIFSSHISSPAFSVTGSVTTFSGATTPFTGIQGTIAYFTFKPMTGKKLKLYINKFKYHKGLMMALEYMINRSVVAVDIKSAGYNMPMPFKLATDLETFGNKFQKHMDTCTPKSLVDYYNTFDSFIDQMWNFILPVPINYTSVGPGSTFTGIINFKGSDLLI